MSSRDQDFKATLGRRDFLKTAIISGIALASSGLVRLIKPETPDSAMAISVTDLMEDIQAATYYFGTDSSARSDPELPQNFYIGRLGVGELFYTGPFNTDAANAAGKYSTHMYWILKGPSYKYRNGRSCYNYGKAQATKAGDAWYTHSLSSYVYGKTIFADIEPPMNPADHYDPEKDDGWEIPNAINQADNREVLRGWLDGIATYTRNGINPGFVPGIYIAPTYWEPWFGTSHVPTRSFALWLSGCICCHGCPPCDPGCSSTKTDTSNLFNVVKNTTIGKSKAVIWQYWLNPGCSEMYCGDYDIAMQSGYSKFNPVTSTTTWLKKCRYETYLPLIGKSPASPPNPYP